MTEPRLSWLLVSLAGAALAAAGYLWGKSSSPAAAPGENVLTSGEREVPGPKGATLRAAVHPSPVAVHVASAAPSDGRDLDPLDGAEVGDELEPEDEELLAQETRKKHFDELSQRVDTEVVDGAWRHATEVPLKRLLSEHLGPKLGVSEAT